MKLSLGFSPCPNDTFIFEALVNKKINLEGLELEVVLDDVQTLNQWAMEGRLSITKLSYGVLPLVLDKYVVLNSGSALGKGVGPILIGKDLMAGQSVENARIAIPGENTTAHLLFSMAYPAAKNKVFLRYDEIEDYVLSGHGPGVIIHENRFTYEAWGLKKIIDLGDFWEQQTGTAIPLGGIVIKRSIGIEIQQKVDRLIRQSIEYAFSNYPQLNEYIRRHSQEMSEEVMRKHIDLYVNEFSLNLGNIGKAAIRRLLNIHPGFGNASKPVSAEIFVPAPMSDA